MKVLASLFFIGLFPIVVLLASFLYGGFTPISIKTALLKANIYEKLPETFSEITQEPDTEFETSEATETDTFLAPILARLKGPYLQEKTEKLIDDVDMWIKKDGITAPKVSFSEIKEDILTANPDLKAMMDEGMAEFGSNEQTEETKKMQEFLKNDFSFELGKSLTPLKDTYRTLTILFPVLLILLMLSLLAIIFFAKGISSKLKWVGITLLLAGLNGIVWAIGTSIISQVGTAFIVSFENQFVQILNPVLAHISTVFLDQYKSYQIIVSIVFAVLGVLMLGGRMFVGQNNVIPASKTAKKKTK